MQGKTSTLTYKIPICNNSKITGLLFESSVLKVHLSGAFVYMIVYVVALCHCIVRSLVYGLCSLGYGNNGLQSAVG